MSRSRFLCLDCGVDTGKIGEHYMLQDHIWRLVHPSPVGMLCVGCLEIRLGRKLRPDDFNDSYVNDRYFGFRSQRLSTALGFVS